MNVGQLLYFVPEGRHNGSPREVRVKHIGRKWVTLEADSNLGGTCGPFVFGRCDSNTGWMDGKGYSSPGRCWASKEAWEMHAALKQTWNSLRMAMELRHPSTEPPSGVTVSDIMQARELLKV